MSAEMGSTLADRIRMLVGTDSVSAFALKCGLLEGSIRQYLGGSIPGIDKAAAIAAAAGVSLQWLATGEGPMTYDSPNPPEPVPVATKPTEIDPQLLAICTQAADNALRELNVHVDKQQHAKLVAQLYNQALNATPEEIERDAEIERKRLAKKREFEEKKSLRGRLAS